MAKRTYKKFVDKETQVLARFAVAQAKVELRAALSFLRANRYGYAKAAAAEAIFRMGEAFALSSLTDTLGRHKDPPKEDS